MGWQMEGVWEWMSRLQSSYICVLLGFLCDMFPKGSNALMILYQGMLQSVWWSIIIYSLNVCRYFHRVLQLLSSGQFYQCYVQLPSENDPSPDFIRKNPKFWPFFQHAIGAMDGTHINACPSSADRHAARNRKGGISQNCLACMSFDMRFLYFISGWEGSAADATMYSRSCLVDLWIPPGKVYLADAGFGICNALLVPYRGVCYHLAEWGRADKRLVFNSI